MSNKWNLFLKQQGGSGLSIKQLKEKYHQVIDVNLISHWIQDNQIEMDNHEVYLMRLIFDFNQPKQPWVIHIKFYHRLDVPGILWGRPINEPIEDVQEDFSWVITQTKIHVVYPQYQIKLEYWYDHERHILQFLNYHGSSKYLYLKKGPHFHTILQCSRFIEETKIPIIPPTKSGRF